MFMRVVALFVGILSAMQAAPPAENPPDPLERDLGLGLTYHRIHDLPADLPTRTPSPLQPSVVDVRYVQASPAAATAFLAWLNFRASPRAPIFVLANAGTDRALLASLRNEEPGQGFQIIGIAGLGFQPDLAVLSNAEDERRAYDALESGTPVGELVTDTPDKVRHDEASLGRERRGEDNSDPAPEGTAKVRPPPRLDATLQRAVQVHRALVALKKI